MPLLVIAFFGTVLFLGGTIAMVYGLVGTTKPVGPPGPLATAARRMWNGGGRSARERRAHRGTLIAGIALGVGAWLFTGLPVVGLMVALAVPGAPWLFNVGKAERESIDHIEAVGEWARRLKDVSVVGMGLQQSIVASAGTAPAAIADPVRDLSLRLQAGVAAHEALMMFADEIADPVCDQVVAALMLHLTDRGDRLGDVLSSIAGAASAEVATRREVDAKRTQSRFAVKFLTITTLLSVAYGAVRPDYMKPYGTPIGQIIMVVLGVLFGGILVWVRNMSRPEKSARFLASESAAYATPRVEAS